MAALQAKRLRKGCYTSIKLDTQTAVSEWDNQKLYIMMEDDAYLTDEGCKFLRPRQQAFYLIKEIWKDVIAASNQIQKKRGPAAAGPLSNSILASSGGNQPAELTGNVRRRRS